MEKTKESAEKLREKYWDSLIKSGWIADPQAQRKKFEDVYKKYGDSFLKNIAEVVKNSSDPDKEWNAAGSLLQVTTMPFAFLGDLIVSGVIPKSAIAAQVVDSSVAALRVYIRSPYTLITA